MNFLTFLFDKYRYLTLNVSKKRNSKDIKIEIIKCYIILSNIMSSSLIERVLTIMLAYTINTPVNFLCAFIVNLLIIPEYLLYY